MRPECEKLAAFSEGQLSAEEREAFYPHLLGCERCRRALEQDIAIDLAAVVDPPGLLARIRGAQAAIGSSSKRRIAIALVPTMAAAAILLAVNWPAHRGSAGEAELAAALQTVTKRPFEGALAHPLPAAQAYKEHDVSLGERDIPSDRSFSAESPRNNNPVARPSKPSSLDDIAFALKMKGDLHGSGIAFLFAHDPQRAANVLKEAEQTTEVINDRAVAALAAKDWEAALSLADEALRRNPDLWQARWNRGLALHGLGLQFAAGRAFEGARALATGAWSREADARASRNDGIHRRNRWLDAQDKVIGMAFRGSPPVDEALADVYPGLVRRFVYAAVRSADSPARVRAFEPLARKLSSPGDDHLRHYLTRVESEDFAVRKPLADEYRELASQPALPAARVASLIAAARKAGQLDIELGAIALAAPATLDAPELERLAASEEDPWNRFLVLKKRAEIAQAHDDPLGAEGILLAALDECDRSRANYRCAELRHTLAGIKARLHQPAEADAHAVEGLKYTRRSGEWGIERSFLADRASAARFNDKTSLARAFIDEMLAEQASPDAVALLYAHVESAHLALEENRPELAHHHLTRVPRSDKAEPPISALEAWSDLAHWDGFISDDERSLVRKDLESLRNRASAENANRIAADVLEGRMLIHRDDRGHGKALLERAIESADAHEKMTVTLRKYRAGAYSGLIQHAARERRFDDALSLLGRELGVTPPPACAFGIASDYDELTLLARDRNGVTRGEHQAIDDRALSDSPRLPESLVAALRDCATIDVIARPPFQGRALLDPRWAWRFLVKRPEAGIAAAPKPPGQSLLLVTNPEPPDWLHLPELQPWSAPPTKDGVRVEILEGISATPQRVIEKMIDATEIEINAHGKLDLAVSDVSHIALTPDPKDPERGAYALTAGVIREQRFRRAPLVILANCSSATPSLRYHEQWSLPMAFIAAGARAVIASPTPLLQKESEEFFAYVRERWLDGVPPSIALRDARRKWIDRGEETSVRNVIVFEYADHP